MSDAPTSTPQAGVRIDDLARQSGLTVDTIRYYQREGLLPAAERCGRANLYGPEHVERLERIKELQGRRFSLAAIKEMPARTQITRHDCVEGWSCIGKWKGARLSHSRSACQ